MAKHLGLEKIVTKRRIQYFALGFHGMMFVMKTLWFKTKKYGYGWTPCSYQGWLVILVYLIAMVATSRVIELQSRSSGDALIITAPLWILYTLLLLLITYRTGEKPRWRWGGK